MRTFVFILLQAEVGGFEKVGGFMAPILSGCAFIMSAAAFIFTVIIQLKERKRNIRQTLAVALSEIAKINVEITELRKDNENGVELTKIWKNYNAQQGTLAANADFLISENEKLITDIDCELMASTFDDLGNAEKAVYYWKKAIALAPNNIQKYVHKCDYASFLFNNNQTEEGRQQFEEALQLKLPDADVNYRQITDSYLTWAKLELNFDNQDEFERLLKEASSYCKMIKNHEKRDDMEKLISAVVKMVKK